MENVVLTFESRVATRTTRTSFRGRERGRGSELNICCKQLVATGHRARPSKTASLSAESGSIMTHEISILYTFSRNQANLFDSKANTLRLLLLNARKWSALQSLRMISITRKGERREEGRTRGRMDAGSTDSNSVRQDRENRKGGEREMHLQLGSSENRSQRVMVTGSVFPP